MLQLSYRGGGDLTVEETEPPPLQEGHVRIRVHSTGLCMSDVYGYAGLNDRRDAVLGDGDVLVMGHETAGLVDACAADVAGLDPGTAVAVNPICGCGRCEHCAAGSENLCERRAVRGCLPSAPGGFAEMMTVPADNVVPLPEGTPIEWGALVEPLCVGFHGVRLARVRQGDAVVVVGGGIVGLGAALAAQRREPESVLVLEPLAARRALAERLGLQAAAPEDVLGSGRVFDVALDCVARPETFRGAVEAVRPQGLVVLVGIWKDEIPLPVSSVVWRETRIVGSYGYSHEDFADVTAWIGSDGVDLAPIIEHRVGFGEVIETFESYADGSLAAVRTLLQPAR